ncbi:MAG: hypothetical protein HY898_32870 [Deltaproteobacteria bacterium]|nr:hypothetical protein [Deltaproteobacteria bacterium]
MTAAPASPTKPKLSSRSLRARFGLALVIAVVIHLPATPVMMLFSFFSSLLAIKDSERVDYDAGTQTISVDLEQLAPQKPPPPPKDKVNAVQMESEPNAESVKIPKGEERQAEGKTDEPDKDPKAEAAEQEKKKLEKKAPEALGLTGEMSKSIQGKTNVTLTVWFSAMRDHPMAESMRPMLACGFLGAAFQRAGVDPIRDLDGALFAGQQLSDPKGYMVAVNHHMTKDKVHEAIDKLLRPKGVWLDEQAAKFYAAKSSRVVFSHGTNLLFITPEPGWEQIRAVRKPLAIPAGRGRVLSLNLLKPSIPFRKLGLRIPDSIVEMRLDIFLSVTGTSEVSLRFEDKDPSLAARHAPEITARLKDFLWQVQKVSDLSGMLSAPSSPSSGSVDIPDIPLIADERAVVGQASLSEEQTAQLVGKLSSLMCAKPKPRPEASSAASVAPSASSSASP